VTEDEERDLKGKLLMADIANKEADTAYKQGLLRFEPWKIVVTAMAAGGGLFAGGAAALGLLLHVMGKL
jgi:hypothetical protein